VTLYWNTNLSGWRLFGVWIRQRWFIGFAVAKDAAHE
jgi:hypothetical protein